jgi:hypothetical protein
MKTTLRAVLLPGLALLCGCLETVVPPHAAGGDGTGNAAQSEPTLFSTLTDVTYRGSSFLQLNQAPYVSTLDGSFIKMYVSRDAASAYEAVSPDTVTMGSPFPVGGIIVREAWDAAGKLKALTAMIKREPGYFADGGDFFFGVLDPAGNIVTENGESLWGPLHTCADCHRQRQSSGFLFGVPPANRH